MSNIKRIARNVVKALPAALCAVGFHGEPKWSAKLDHDKRKRKVYSVENFLVCSRCGTRLD